MKATPEYIVKTLCQNGFHTYIVGGAVRDMLCGKLPHDEDIVTEARPEQIREIFKDHTISFAGTYFKVTFVDGIEVATFRKDRYEGLNDKLVEVEYAKDIYEDLSRRDLTINAIAMCQMSGIIIDPYSGKEDLKKRQIKFVGNAKDRIYEDPNRIIRACRFLAIIDGEFDKETLEALKEYSFLIEKHVAPERIHHEIIKAMKARFASVFFNSLHRIDALKYIFPSMECCYDFQDLHGSHHNEPIITHCYFTGDEISSKYPLLKLAGYLHDVGKPYACRWNAKSNDVAFNGHSEVGADIVEKELRNLKFSNEEIKYISSLVRLHMNFFDTPKSIRRIFRNLQLLEIDWRDLLRLRFADGRSNMKKNLKLSDRKRLYKNIIEAISKKENIINLEIDGNEIMKLMGLKPGPKVGAVKNHLLELVLENPELNTKENLRKVVIECYQKALF